MVIPIIGYSDCIPAFCPSSIPLKTQARHSKPRPCLRSSPANPVESNRIACWHTSAEPVHLRAKVKRTGLVPDDGYSPLLCPATAANSFNSTMPTQWATQGDHCSCRRHFQAFCCHAIQHSLLWLQYLRKVMTLMVWSTHPPLRALPKTL
jgi:hypothetical protein